MKQRKPAKIDVNQKPYFQPERLTKSVCEPFKNRAQTQFIPQEKKRIMNYNLIQVEGIPIEIANEKKLINKQYFGRYGEVLNLKLTLPKDQNKDSPSKMSAYVTYENQLNASLALLGTSETYYSNKKITSLFGTNRYCQSFLDGQGCKKGMCFYLHKFDAKNQAQLEQHGRNRHYQRAIETVIKNLEKVPPIQIKESKQNQPSNQSSYFCLTIAQIVKKLIKLNKFTEEFYNKFQVKQNQKVFYRRRSGAIDLTKSVVFQKEQKKEEINQLANAKMASSMIIEHPTICEKPQFAQQIESITPLSQGNPIRFNDLIQDAGERILIRVLADLAKNRGYSRLGFTKTQDIKSSQQQKNCKMLEQAIRKELTK